ncbi:MAG: hypothetical protein ACOX6T_22650 [Myxococcales bacterium]|jgi:hypothetical protein
MAKKLHKTASTKSFLRQGEETVIRLGLFPESAPLAEPVRVSTAALQAATDKLAACEQALIPSRVKGSVADDRWDTTVRGFARMTEVAVGGTKTPAYRDLFPKGFAMLITPSGEPQRTGAKEFLVHLDSCSASVPKAVFEEWRPKLQAAFEELGAALDERKTAESALAVARAELQAARRDFSRTIDKTIAEVRALFPEDRRRQDLIFPSIDVRRRDDIDGPVTDDEPDEG